LNPKSKIARQIFSTVEINLFNVRGSNLENPRATHAGAKEGTRRTAAKRLVVRSKAGIVRMLSMRRLVSDDAFIITLGEIM